MFTIRPEHLSYVIYTSGSTGSPKGVLITNRTIFDWTSAMQSHNLFSKDDITLSVAPMSFDQSIQDYFCVLMTGGTLLLTTDEERTDVAALKRLLGKVTQFPATPSLLKAQGAVPDPSPRLHPHRGVTPGTSGRGVPIFFFFGKVDVEKIRCSAADFFRQPPKGKLRVRPK